MKSRDELLKDIFGDDPTKPCTNRGCVNGLVPSSQSWARRGSMNPTKKCPTCNGVGLVVDYDELDRREGLC